MAYNLPLKLHTTTLSTGTSHAAKPFTGYDETKAALNLLKNISNEEDLKNKFQKIQDFSNNSMMRGGRQNLPDVSTINFQRFDQTFMKGDFLCPAQYELMQYIDPGQYNSLGLNKPEFGKDQPGVSALIKQGFDDEEWIKNKKPLEFLGVFFGKSDIIINQLREWDNLWDKNLPLIIQCKDPGDKNSLAAQFLRNILSTKVEFKFGPTDLTSVKKEIGNELTHLNESGHGVNQTIIKQKLKEIQFEINMIKESFKADNKSVDKNIRYKILEKRELDLQNIKGQTEHIVKKMKSLMTDENLLAEIIIPVSSKSLKDELDGKTDPEKATYLYDNKSVIIDYAKTILAQTFTPVWTVMADEFHQSLGRDLEGDLNEKLLNKFKNDGNESLLDIVKKRLNNWAIDISLIKSKNLTPDRVFSLWGRHAGIEKSTIENAWKTSANSIETLITKLKEICDQTIKEPGKNSETISKRKRMKTGLDDLKAILNQDPAKQKDSNLVIVETDELTSKNIQTKRITKAKESVNKIKKFIMNRLQNDQWERNQYQFEPSKSLVSLWSPLVRDGHDGKKEVLHIFKNVDKSKLAQKVLQKLYNDQNLEPSDDEIINKIRKEISNGTSDSDQFKFDYIKNLIAWYKDSNNSTPKIFHVSEFTPPELEASESVRNPKLIHESDKERIVFQIDSIKARLIQLDELKRKNDKNYKMAAKIHLSKIMNLGEINEVELFNKFIDHRLNLLPDAPLNATDHQFVRRILKGKNEDFIIDILKHSKAASIIKCVFHDESQWTKINANLMQNVDEFFGELATFFKEKPRLLLNYLKPDSKILIDSALIENSLNMFKLNESWEFADQQMLIAATVNWPTQLRSNFANGLNTLFSGQRGHVMDTEISQPETVLHRYLIRSGEFSKAESPPIDDVWSAMLKLNITNNCTKEAEGVITKEQFKERIENSITNLLRGIKVQELPNNEMNFQGDLSALGIVCESLTDLKAQGINVEHIVNLVLNKVYFASSSNVKMNQIKLAVLSYLFNNPDLLSNEVTLKCMIMLKDISGDNQELKMSAANILENLKIDIWRDKVNQALTALSGAEDLKLLEEQLNFMIFKSVNGKINFSQSNGGVKELTFEETTNLFRLKSAIKDQNGLNFEFSLDPITMTVKEDKLDTESLEEKHKDILRKLHFKNREIPSSFNVITEDGKFGKRLGVNGAFLVFNDKVLYQPNPHDEAFWLTNVQPNQVYVSGDRTNSSQSPFEQYIREKEYQFWKSTTGEVFIYDTNMICQFKIDTNKKITRTSDGHILKEIKKHNNKFQLIFENNGQQILEITSGSGKLKLKKLLDKFIDSDGFIFQDQEQMVFKHPDRAEFKVVEFDPYNSGIPVIKTSRNPQDDSLMALSLSNVKELTDHVVGADTLSQIIDITSNLKTYKDNDDELNKILNSKFLSLLSVPMQATTVDANSLKIFIKKLQGETEINPVCKQLILNALYTRLPEIKCRLENGSIVPSTSIVSNLKLDSLDFDEITNENLKNTVVLSQFITNIKAHQDPITILNKINLKILTPLQKRVLIQYLTGIPDENNAVKKMKQDLNINQSLITKATYSSVMAHSMEDNNSPAKQALAGNYKNNKTECQNQLVIAEKKLKRLLQQKNIPHLTPNDILNLMIQGDPYGILGTDIDQKALIERMALNVLILNTESHHLEDVKNISDYKDRAYLDDLKQAINATAVDAQAGYDALRRAAVYLACENQLGHRLRGEQYSAVKGILEGTTKIAELRTAFGKTDVVLFLVALYKGYGRGVRMSSPDPLITMNMKQMNRKFGGMFMNVWQPSLDFNAIKDASDPIALKNFLKELIAHNRRGDIMFASHYSFDQQFDDLANLCKIKGKDQHVAEIIKIRKELTKMALNLDEVHTFDTKHKFNIMDGEEKFKDFQRVELAKKTISTIHKKFLEFTSMKTEDLAIDQSDKYNDFILRESKNLFKSILENENLPAGMPTTWVNMDPKIAMVHKLIFNIGPQVYRMQHNLNYGFREGTLEAVPYVANNEASLNQNYTDAEQIQWLTFNARQIEQKKSIEVSAPMLNRLYAAYSQLAPNLPSDSKLKEVLDYVLEYGNIFNSPNDRMIAFNALASGNKDTNAEMAKLTQLLVDLTETERDDCTFYLFGNTAVKERLFESNPAQANMRDYIDGECLGITGTLDESIIPEAFKGNKEILKTKIQLDGQEYEFDDYYKHVFGVEKKTGLNQKMNQDNCIRVSNSDETVDTFIEEVNKNNVQLLVDAGALIQGKKNRDIAESLAKKTQKWVVYYDESPDKKDLYAIKEHNNQFSELTYTELEKKAKTNVDLKDNIIVYFDEAHKTGTDVQGVTRKSNPKMLVTASKNNTTMDMHQAIGRDRTRTYDFNLVVRKSEFQENTTIPQTYEKILQHTTVESDQNKFTMIMMEAKALINDDINKQLEQLDLQHLKIILNDKEFIENQKFLVSTEIKTGIEEFVSATADLTTKDQLKTYIKSQKDQLQNVINNLNKVFKKFNLTLDVTKEKDNRKIIYEQIFGKVDSINVSTENPILISLASGTAEAQAEAVDESQSQSMAQQQSQTAQVQAQEMAMATSLAMQTIDNTSQAPEYKLFIDKVEPQKRVSEIDVPQFYSPKDVFDKINSKDAHFADQMQKCDMLQSIQFSECWLQDLGSSKVPRVHAIVEKDDTVFIITPEELANPETLKNGPLKDGRVIYETIMEATEDFIEKLPIPKKSQYIFLLSIINHKTDLVEQLVEREIAEGTSKAFEIVREFLSLSDSLTEDYNGTHNKILQACEECCKGRPGHFSKAVKNFMLQAVNQGADNKHSQYESHMTVVTRDGKSLKIEKTVKPMIVYSAPPRFGPDFNEYLENWANEIYKKAMNNNNPTDSLPSASQVKAKVLGDIKELNQNLETIKQTETDKLRFELSNTKKLQTRKTELETQKHNIENDIKSLESELKMTSSNITDLQKEVVDLQGQVLNEKALSKVKDEIKTIIVTNLKDFLGNIKINELAEIFDDIESLFDSPITLERLKTSLFEKLDNIQSKLADYKNKKMAVNDEITGKWASLCDEATQLTVDKHSSPERNLKKIDTTLYQLDNEMHQMVLMNGNNQVEVSKLQKYLIKIRSSKQRLIDEHNLIQDELNDANRTRNNLQRKFFNRYLKSPLQAFRKKYTDEQCQYLTPLNNALENLKKTKLAEARQNIMSSSSTGFELNYYFTNLINFSPKFNTVLKSLVKDKTIPSTTKGMDELLESLKQQGGITDGEHKQAMKLIRNCRVRDDINLVPIQKLTFMFYFLFKCCDDTLLQQSFTNDDLLAAQEMVKKEFENLEQQEVEAIRRLKELEGTNDRYEELEIYKQELLKSKAHYEQSIENQRKTFAQIEELKTQSAQAEKEAEMFKNIWMKFRGQTGVNTRLKEDIDSKIQLKNEKIKESITNFENKGRELIFKAEKYKELTESIQRKKEEEENATYLITELTDLITRNTEDFNQKLSSIAQQTVNDCIKEQLANMMDSNDNTINEVLQIFLEIYSEEFIRAKDTNFVEDPNALFKFEQIEFDDISIKWPTLNPNAMTLFDDEKLAESAPDILKNLCRLMNIQNSLQVEDGSSMFCLTEKSALIKAKSELFKKLIENNALNLTGINLANYLKKYDIQDQALQITLNKVITNALKKQIVDQELDFEALVKEMDKYLKQRTRDDIRKTVTTEQTNKLILNSKNSMVGSSTNNPTHQLTECIPCTPFGPPPVHMIRSEVHN